MGETISTKDFSKQKSFEASGLESGCCACAPKGHVFIIESGGKYASTVEDDCICLNPIMDNVAYHMDSREFIVECPTSKTNLADNVTVSAMGVAQIDILSQKQAVYKVSDFLDSMRNSVANSVRETLGKLTLSEVFSNRSTITTNVEHALNQFFESNENCAVLKRFEVTQIKPQGLDLTQESIAERQKISDIIISQANQYKQQKESEANQYRSEKIAEASKYKIEKMGEADKMVILYKTKAEQESIRLLSEVINAPNGDKIVKVKLIQQYMEHMRKVYKNSNNIIAPKSATNLKPFLALMGKGI